MMSAKEKICCALIALGQIVGWGGFWILLMIDDTKSDTSECGFWISNDTYKIETNYAKEFAELYERYGKDSDLQSSAKK